MLILPGFQHRPYGIKFLEGYVFYMEVGVFTGAIGKIISDELFQKEIYDYYKTNTIYRLFVFPFQ